MVPTDLPSIWRWKARSHPQFGTLSTIRRPGGGLPCATMLMEIAHTKARIRRTFGRRHGGGVLPVRVQEERALEERTVVRPSAVRSFLYLLRHAYAFANIDDV